MPPTATGHSSQGVAEAASAPPTNRMLVFLSTNGRFAAAAVPSQLAPKAIPVAHIVIDGEAAVDVTSV